MVPPEGQSGDNVGHGLGAHGSTVAHIFHQVAERKCCRPDHRVMAAAEEVGQQSEAVGCADDVSDIHRPLERRKTKRNKD